MISARVQLLRSIAHDVCKVYIRHAKKLDAGVGKRAKLLSVETEELSDMDFDESESDFMDVHRSHRKHLDELETMKEREKYFIVRQKYFKEKTPNFLTWHDKEQMRYLHRTDPEEWTVEKLSEGFPALPETIAIIIKSNWTKKNQTKIANHDHAVQMNWNLFKEAKMSDLPKEVKQHLKKFTTRDLIFTPFQVPESNEANTLTVKAKSRCTDFSDIITNYEKLKNKSKREAKHEEEKDKAKRVGLIDESVPSKNSDLVTLDLLKLDLEDRVAHGKCVTRNDEILLDQLKEADAQGRNVMQLKQEDLSAITKQKKFSDVNVSVLKPRKDLSHLMYSERIKIPRKLHKKGYTYKLKDCYYDDDGTFLYRVPGMVN